MHDGRTEDPFAAGVNHEFRAAAGVVPVGVDAHGSVERLAGAGQAHDDFADGVAVQPAVEFLVRDLQRPAVARVLLHGAVVLTHHEPRLGGRRGRGFHPLLGLAEMLVDPAKHLKQLLGRRLGGPGQTRQTQQERNGNAENQLASHGLVLLVGEVLWSPDHVNFFVPNHCGARLVGDWHRQARVHQFAPGERRGLAGIRVRQRQNIAARVTRDEDVGLDRLGHVDPWVRAHQVTHILHFVRTCVRTCTQKSRVPPGRSIIARRFRGGATCVAPQESCRTGLPPAPFLVQSFIGGWFFSRHVTAEATRLERAPEPRPAGPPARWRRRSATRRGGHKRAADHQPAWRREDPTRSEKPTPHRRRGAPGSSPSIRPACPPTAITGAITTRWAAVVSGRSTESEIT